MVSKVLAGLINFFTSVAELFLGFRVILRLFGANPTVPFVRWVYDSSGVLMQPFRGIFPTAVIKPDFLVDFSAIFAMIVYGLVGLALLSLVVYLSPGDTVFGRSKR